MALDEQVIQYLSKEIDTHTSTLIDFRARAHFSLFIAPFVLLGVVVISQRGLPGLSWHLAAGVIGLILSYAALGMVACSIEGRVWRQCNAWRSVIAELASRETSDQALVITARSLHFEPRSLKLVYACAWISMFVAFISTLAILWSLPPSPSPPKAATQLLQMSAEQR
jgi:hypothetical protein